MRVDRVIFICLASAVIGASASAQTAKIAQPAPTRTVDDYVCTFAPGQCADQTRPPQPNSPNGPSRGFHLSVPEARPSAPSQSSGSVPQPPASNVQRSSSSSTSPAVRTNRAPVRQASRTEPSSATAARRMDLRLSFELGSAELTAQAQQEAKVFAEALQRPQLADKKFLIEGHTDSIGSRASNMDLSRRRAAAVVDYLTSLGVGRDRLQARGYGPSRPLPGHRPNSPENRRVEARLL